MLSRNTGGGWSNNKVAVGAPEVQWTVTTTPYQVLSQYCSCVGDPLPGSKSLIPSRLVLILFCDFTYYKGLLPRSENINLGSPLKYLTTLSLCRTIVYYRPSSHQSRDRWFSSPPLLFVGWWSRPTDLGLSSLSKEIHNIVVGDYKLVFVAKVE